jgi:hypothetical protein
MEHITDTDLEMYVAFILNLMGLRVEAPGGISFAVGAFIELFQSFPMFDSVRFNFIDFMIPVVRAGLSWSAISKSFEKIIRNPFLPSVVWSICFSIEYYDPIICKDFLMAITDPALNYQKHGPLLESLFTAGGMDLTTKGTAKSQAFIPDVCFRIQLWPGSLLARILLYKSRMKDRDIELWEKLTGEIVSKLRDASGKQLDSETVGMLEEKLAFLTDAVIEKNDILLLARQLGY